MANGDMYDDDEYDDEDDDDADDANFLFIHLVMKLRIVIFA